MGSPRVYCRHFVLIGAMNPCPCGYYGDPVHECTCSNAMVSRYQKRIPSPSLRTGSGPLLDRIDVHIEVPRVEYEKLSDDRLVEPSAAIRARVESARARQAARFAGTRLLANADMGPAEAREYCRLAVTHACKQGLIALDEIELERSTPNATALRSAFSIANR